MKEKENEKERSIFCPPGKRIRCPCVKGKDPVFYRKGDKESVDYAWSIVHQAGSLDKHYHLVYPGNISKRAYRKLGTEDRALCGTYYSLFVSIGDPDLMVNLLMDMSQKAGLERTDEGFWVYPTDYGAHPDRLVQKAKSEVDVCDRTDSQSTRVCVSDKNGNKSAPSSQNLTSDASLSLTDTYQQSIEMPALLVKMMAEKDRIIQQQSEKAGMSNQLISELTSSKKAAQDVIQELGKRIDIMKSDFELERKTWASEKQQLEITAQVMGWKLAALEISTKKGGMEGSDPVKRLYEGKEAIKTEDVKK